MSSSTSSIHLFLGLPLILLPIGFHSSILLGILIPSIASYVLARLFFCFLWILLCLHFLWVRSVHGSFSFSRIHFHLVLGQRFSLVFSAQIFLVFVHIEAQAQAQASHPYLTAGLIKVLYIFSFKLLTWKIWWAPNNASKWKMGFNSAFKGVNDPMVSGNYRFRRTADQTKRHRLPRGSDKPSPSLKTGTDRISELRISIFILKPETMDEFYSANDSICDIPPTEPHRTAHETTNRHIPQWVSGNGCSWMRTNARAQYVPRRKLYIRAKL